MTESREPIILVRPNKTQDIELAWLPPPAELLKITGQPYQNHPSQIYRTGQRDPDTDARYLDYYTYRRVFIAGWWQKWADNKRGEFMVIAHTQPTELYFNPDTHDGYPMHHPWVVVYEGEGLALYDTQRKPLTRGQVRHNPWWAVELTDSDEPTLQVPDLTEALPVMHLPDLMPSRELPDPRIKPKHLGYMFEHLCAAGQAFVSLPIHTLAALSNRTRIDSIAAYAWICALWMNGAEEFYREDPRTMDPTNPKSWPEGHSTFVWHTLLDDEPVPETLREVFA